MLNTIVPLIAFAAAAVAQSPSATTSQPESTTASLLLGTLTTGFSGTIVSAEPCRTTYALTCSGQEICPDPVTLTAIQGPAIYEYNFATSVSNDRGEGQAYMSQSCSLQNSATAECRMWESISFEGRSSTANLKTTLSGDQLVYAQVPITGGLESVAEATGSCSSAPAPTAVAQGGAMPTGFGLGSVVNVVVPVVIVANALL